ncbi:glycoside hydrolase family 95 protein [Jonesia denitrificans]|uniref:Uncharacterized protein n=1 Tax=Jonesia denitrificans (strain ATCC 14870 / DSM 20603 / BCRC 15368 / CIP 55.134 / JCM 11481 / NBRC 15587 / NCTC 10816 / Prevot 55134) TaxID=471856 RepID=C7QZB0_JONDD|nr:glycoside hydrolase family 95 protein [Jonesia denitrificans]ACV09408.1 conserved hypothetical protein [Jonesia denitrificans DSM 20603]QXB43889.1 glycoside hydrolase family 95 protein [Jonesia denitrificans]SQH21727.1 Uncharacterised protein [Jonesia denitrificans]
MNRDETTKSTTAHPTDSPEQLSLNAPCTTWVEALPLGNGILGVMDGAHAAHTTLWINHHATWSGHPATAYQLPPAADNPTWLIEARLALARQDYPTITRILKSTQTPHSQAFLPLAHLTLTPTHSVTFISRHLDFSTATSHAIYATADNSTIHHRTWVPRADNYSPPFHLPDTPHAPPGDGSAIIHTITNHSPHTLHYTISTDTLLRPHTQHTTHRPHLTVRLPSDVAPTHETTDHHITYDHTSASQTLTWATTSAATPTTLTIAPHTTGILVLTANTPADPTEPTAPVITHLHTHAERIRDALTNAGTPPTAELAGPYARHVAAHRQMYTRTSLHIAADPHATRQFHMGRHLLITTLHPNALPITLQGLWNAELPPPWSSNYTLNINTPMNYWAADQVGLGEHHTQLRHWLTRAAAGPGRYIANALYHAPGFVLHHNSDRWGYATPAGAGHGDPAWSFWPMGGLWLTLTAWDHITYTDDLTDAAHLWPLIEGAAHFALHWLTHDGTTTHSAPSTSPEHTFTHDGTTTAITDTPTMDIALLTELHQVATHAAAMLNKDAPWLAPLGRLIADLPTPRITTSGHLAEWTHNHPSAEPNHRHLSHLIGLYPFRHLTTPELRDAAMASLNARGPESTGWALAWRIALSARARRNEDAATWIARSLRPMTQHTGPHHGGLYPSLLSAHPPFQIDGNLGYLAGVCACLIDATTDTITLLPALPPAWTQGHITGLHLPGRLTCEITWRNAAPDLVTVTLHAQARQPARRTISFGTTQRSITVTPGETLRFTGRHLQENTTQPISLKDNTGTHTGDTPPRETNHGDD